MKYLALFASIFLAGTCAWGQSSIYGASGLPFVPTGDVASDQRFGLSVGGSIDDDPTWVTAVRTSWLDQRLEVSLSNTWALVENDSNGFRPRTSAAFPIVPSIKFVLDHDRTRWQAWSSAVGFSMPYGVYGAVTWRLNLPVVSPAITAGMGTPIKTFHVFGGARLDLCDFDGDKLPVALLADASYGGSTRTIGESAEAFWSAGVETSIGRNLTMRVFHRRDRGYDAPDDRQNRDGKSFLQLSWSFDGVKVAPVAKESKP